MSNAAIKTLQREIETMSEHLDREWARVERLTAEISKVREGIHKIELQKEELGQALEQLKGAEL